MLVDNDSGGKKTFGVVSKKAGGQVDGSADFYFITKNLYMVAIPKKNGKDTATEDCFQDSTLLTKVSGKSFNRNNDHDTKSEYGKHYFATHVVAKQHSEIDFSGFRGVLKRIDLVIQEHKKKVTP